MPGPYRDFIRLRRFLCPRYKADCHSIYTALKQLHDFRHPHWIWAFSSCMICYDFHAPTDAIADILYKGPIHSSFFQAITSLVTTGHETFKQAKKTVISSMIACKILKPGNVLDCKVPQEFLDHWALEGFPGGNPTPQIPKTYDASHLKARFRSQLQAHAKRRSFRQTKRPVLAKRKKPTNGPELDV
jgi:hypothetical protein